MACETPETLCNKCLHIYNEIRTIFGPSFLWPEGTTVAVLKCEVKAEDKKDIPESFQSIYTQIHKAVRENVVLSDSQELVVLMTGVSPEADQDVNPLAARMSALLGFPPDVEVNQGLLHNIIAALPSFRNSPWEYEVSLHSQTFQVPIIRHPIRRHNSLPNTKVQSSDSPLTPVRRHRSESQNPVVLPTTARHPLLHLEWVDKYLVQEPWPCVTLYSSVAFRRDSDDNSDDGSDDDKSADDKSGEKPSEDEPADFLVICRPDRCPVQ